MFFVHILNGGEALRVFQIGVCYRVPGGLSYGSLMRDNRNSPVAAPERDTPTPEPRSAPSSGGRLPELLAPAGDWECAKAAVENGADAIYFGLEKFNARMRANNFTEADLPKLMEFLHRRGVKGYVTFNILVFENEMADAEQYVRAIIAAGVDAAVVQDVGLCRLIRQYSSDFPIHVSTQMTITSAAGMGFARELGCNLVVLARECSLKEIAALQSSQLDNYQLSTLDYPLPIEVFIHGALCVAYSGQCLTSEALGGRSANRGECAQACRMPYELIADGKPVPLGDRKYLLSPQDLAGLEVLPELARIGVASLKIEGRLKSPEYVANITRIYRNAIDRIGGEARVTSDDHYKMEMAFSRGLYSGWFRGTNNQALVHGRFGKKRGVFLGEVSRVEGECVWVRLQGPLKPGDGLVFDAGHPEGEEEGGRVYEIRSPKSEVRSAKYELRTGQAVELRFGRGDIDFKRIHVGDKLWKTSDPELDRRLRRSFEGDTVKFQRPIQMEVHGLAGKPLTFIARDELGHTVRLDSAMPLARAEKQPLTSDRLGEQLGRLGGTPFKQGELNNFLEGDVVLPVSELNRLRREAVRELEALRTQPKRWNLECGMEANAAATAHRYSARRTPHLIVLVRNLAQLEAALKSGLATLYCEFEDPKKYREAVALARRRQSEMGAPLEIFVAPPRIFKLGEEWTLKQVRSCEADGYLVRNYDHLRYFANDRRIGDYSLNIANRLAAEYFKQRFGLERVTASYDLNCGQLEALLQAAPPEWFEITIHQHMPMFHMEHCVFCAFLTNGTDYTNCGRPCDKHDLKLRDRVGAEHPVKADVGCRNTVFHSLAQTGAEHVSRLLALGARLFRIEFLNETPGQVAETISTYRQLLEGRITGSQVWRELKALNQLGVTRGQIGARVRT
jgi:U32 family peptidase